MLKTIVAEASTNFDISRVLVFFLDLRIFKIIYTNVNLIKINI